MPNSEAANMAEETPTTDVEMAGDDDVIEVSAPGTVAGIEVEASNSQNENGGATVPEVQIEVEAEEPAPKGRVAFVNYLKSPIVELLVGRGENQSTLSAHQALLVQSPWFEEACARFGDVEQKRQIEMIGEDLETVGCYLEWVYTGEYFPKRLPDRTLEKDSDTPVMDSTGDQLLKHAKVYTLADKLGIHELKTLAHSKIHCVDSTARGEIVYARYVYANTPKEDITIRKPVAAFWAQRSHVLRHDAGDEFRQMCLEFPQFGYDVLTRVLDEKQAKEKKEHPASARKRQRQSNV